MSHSNANFAQIPLVRPIKSILIEKHDESLNAPIRKRKYQICEEDETDSNRDLKQFKFDTIIKKIEHKSNQCEEFSESCLWSIANEYNNLLEWKKLSVLLGLTRQDVQIIEAKYLQKNGLLECFYQCLLKWRQRKPENCYSSYFQNVLLKLKSRKSKNKTSKEKKLKKIPKNEKYLKNCNILNYFLNNTKTQNENIPELAEVKLNEKALWKISDLICEEWKPLSRDLGIRETNIAQIEAKYLYTDGLRECCYQSLILWSEIAGDFKPNLENICLCLIDRGLNLYAKNVLELVLL